MTHNNDNANKLTAPTTPRLRPPFLLALCLVFGLGTGVFFDRWMLGVFVPSDAAPNFRLMAQAWNLIERHYVDRAAVKPTTLTDGAISGMVDALGDTGHSAYLTRKMVKRLGVVESGKLKGVGLEIQMKDQHVVIVAPIDNSPAQRAGLRSGEIIMSVDGRDIAGLPLDQVVARITGPVGTSVKMGILNPKTHQLRDITLVRATIKIQNVTWQQLPGTEVADVRLASFNKGADDDLRQALREIHQQQLRGLILDLRDNPGGELDEAVAVASEFLTNGPVLLVKNADGKTTPVPVKPGGLALDLPMAVLVNGGTASAAEIVAGALSDAHRATLVGQTTFGTGTVLREFPLLNGSALMLAVQEWLTPDGNSFWHKGITPELAVAMSPGTDLLVPGLERQMTALELESSNDRQLLRALKCVTEKIADLKKGGGPIDASAIADQSGKREQATPVHDHSQEDPGNTNTGQK
ncbi:MAG TPA: S41 family peptidase [Verrucomicrobiae bacterium]|nr:S41 family peptidase [Verrucomicrobiae bacterium]